MRALLQNWLRWEGTLTRHEFSLVTGKLALAALAVVCCALLLDRAARPDAPPGAPTPVLNAAALLYVAAALPIAFGAMARRLRDAGMSPWLLLLVLVPIGPLALFVLLLLPTRHATADADTQS